MSYSRWINSTWYTFWSSSKSSSRGDEQFACLYSLDHQFMWSYNMVCDFIEDQTILESVLQQIQPTPLEISELLEYMKVFVIDVNLSHDRKLAEIRGGQ